MKYVGLDISMTDTGYSVLDDFGNPVLYGSVKSKPGLPDTERFFNISEKLVENIKPRCGDVFLIEGYAYGASNRLPQMAELTGLIKFRLFRDFKIPGSCIWVVAPTTLKKFITGKGNAQKDLILLRVWQKWQVDITNDNIADAFGLSKLMFIAANNCPSVKYEEEVLKTLYKANGAEKDGRHPAFSVLKDSTQTDPKKFFRKPPKFKKATPTKSKRKNRMD